MKPHSDDEQGINKLWPYQNLNIYICVSDHRSAKILKIKKNFAVAKKPKYRQRGAKLKCSIGKKTIRHIRLFSATLPNKIFLKSIFTYYQ